MVIHTYTNLKKQDKAKPDSIQHTFICDAIETLVAHQDYLIDFGICAYDWYIQYRVEDKGPMSNYPHTTFSVASAILFIFVLECIVTSEHKISSK